MYGNMNRKSKVHFFNCKRILYYSVGYSVLFILRLECAVDSTITSFPKCYLQPLSPSVQALFRPLPTYLTCI